MPEFQIIIAVAIQRLLVAATLLSVTTMVSAQILKPPPPAANQTVPLIRSDANLSGVLLSLEVMGTATTAKITWTIGESAQPLSIQIPAQNTKAAIDEKAAAGGRAMKPQGITTQSLRPATATLERLVAGAAPVKINVSPLFMTFDDSGPLESGKPILYRMTLTNSLGVVSKKETQYTPPARESGPFCWNCSPTSAEGQGAKSKPESAEDPISKGYEVILGKLVVVPPLGTADLWVKCSPDKVAISVGYEFVPGSPGVSADALYGYEIYGALPYYGGQDAVVSARNANVFVAGSARAIAICISNPARVRKVQFNLSPPFADASANKEKFMGSANCGYKEFAIGGGLRGDYGFTISSNGPIKASTKAPNGGWTASQIKNSPAILMPTSALTAILFCAAASNENGLEYVESSVVRLSSRAAANPTLICPPTKLMLAIGVIHVDEKEPTLDLVVSSLKPNTSSSSSWTAQIRNRNILGGSSNYIDVKLAGICGNKPF
jgi:hypothetical protein